MNDHKDMANDYPPTLDQIHHTDYIYHTPGFFGILTRYLFEFLLLAAGILAMLYIIIKIIKWLWLL